MLLERPRLDKIVDADGVLLAEPMQPPNALLNFHRVPGQIEVGETMRKLQIAAFGAAVSQQQRPAAFMESFRDRLALRRRGRAVYDEGLDAGAAKFLGERALGLKELREDHRATFSAREGLEQFAFSAPTLCERRLVAPGPGRSAVRKFLEAVAPGGRTAAGGLQEEPAPEAGLAGAQLGQP